MMDNKPVQIEPLEVVTVRHRHSFSVNIVHVKMFESVMIAVTFLDENKAIIDRTTLNLTGDDYKNWGTDDNYLVNYVATKYGMKIKA